MIFLTMSTFNTIFFGGQVRTRTTPPKRSDLQSDCRIRTALPTLRKTH